ncbi:hypothetical protein CDAR_86701 [Caerostris darwini]|uniref:Uncharacterized protein n=1 Tax=Caerostris darwini TaxID=1538125 RepID=A0AAV4VEX4_9ARAC|nr:hypothetical protein CDAR_86701 [Caerostris darwini]
MESTEGSSNTSHTLLGVSFSATYDKIAIGLRIIFNFRNERNSRQGFWAMPMNVAEGSSERCVVDVCFSANSIPSRIQGNLPVKELNGVTRSLMKCVEKEEFCTDICVKSVLALCATFGFESR